MVQASRLDRTQSSTFVRTRLRAGLAVPLAGGLALALGALLPSLPLLLVVLAVVPPTLALTDRALPRR